VTRKQKSTLGEMREMGVRGLLVYCSDYHCSYWTTMSGDRPDDARLSDIEQRFTCQACGTKRADLRPNFHWEREARQAGGAGFGSQGTMSIILVWRAGLAHASACGPGRVSSQFRQTLGGTVQYYSPERAETPCPGLTARTRVMDIKNPRVWLTVFGVLTARPVAFVVFALYVLA